MRPEKLYDREVNNRKRYGRDHGRSHFLKEESQSEESSAWRAREEIKRRQMNRFPREEIDPFSNNEGDDE